MKKCSHCEYAPHWESEALDTKGLCLWWKQFSGIGLPASIKSWLRHHDDFAGLVENLMHPVTRESGQQCQAFRRTPKAVRRA